MKTVAQVVGSLRDLFTSRNIDSLEYNFSREIEGKRIAFFNVLVFVSLEDIRHIANTLAPSEDSYPDFTGAIEKWDSAKELEANTIELKDGNIHWLLADKDTLRVMVEHIKDDKIESIFNVSLTIKENILS